MIVIIAKVSGVKQNFSNLAKNFHNGNKTFRGLRNFFAFGKTFTHLVKHFQDGIKTFAIKTKLSLPITKLFEFGEKLSR